MDDDKFDELLKAFIIVLMVIFVVLAAVLVISVAGVALATLIAVYASAS